MLELSDKYFEVAFINMLKVVKENMLLINEKIGYFS